MRPNRIRPPISVPVLTAVTPSLGNGYSMMFGGVPAYETADRATSGELKHLVLPTLGGVGWTYEAIRFGGIHSHRSPGIEMPTGVASRTTYDANGTALGTTSYLRIHSIAELCDSHVCVGNAPTCSSGRSRQMTVFITDPLTSDGVQKTTINYFSNYEYIGEPEGDTCLPPGWVSAEHGLPFTRYAESSTNSQRFLSSEVRTGFSPSDFAITSWDGRGAVPDSGTRLRQTYLSYRLDSDGAGDLERL